MPVLEIGPLDGLYYEYAAPAAPDRPTFVFVNPITGDASLWQAAIGPALRAAGFGTLAWNFRGQAKSPWSPGLALDDKLIAGDLQRLVAALAPARPVLVGLSIGGLYAARAYLAGCRAAGLVLVNTLRLIGPRLAWMNDATLRAIEVGGPQLIRDLLTPLIFGPDWLRAHREEFLKPDTVYAPLDRASGAYNLLTWMGRADWDLPYERLDCPVLVVSGLHDRIFFEDATVAALCRRLPRARRVDVAEAGHMLPAEAPGRFAALLRDFAAELG